MSGDAAIRSMPLHTHLNRVDRGLAALGIGPADAIPPERLFPLDQWHCHGTDAVRAAVEQLGLGPAGRVLDIDSGVGGLARYFAHTTGCHVTALELQPELHAIATDLTLTLRPWRARHASLRRRAQPSGSRRRVRRRGELACDPAHP
ncbi:MAG TPA: hypothetical protein VJ779_04135 [Acetobacteraceae bacterium]|nr:hypothetical protein [Acetobacteraceae bacterium]